MKKHVFLGVLFLTTVALGIYFWSYAPPSAPSVIEGVTQSQVDDLPSITPDDRRQNAISTATLLPRVDHGLKEYACIESVYDSDRRLYDYWESVFSVTYPNMEVYDAGSLCALPENETLLSFSFHRSNPTASETSEYRGGQALVVFDKYHAPRAAILDLSMRTPGDLGFPRIVALNSSAGIFSIGGGDAGLSLADYYRLDLQTFSYRKIADYFSSASVPGSLGDAYGDVEAVSDIDVTLFSSDAQETYYSGEQIQYANGTLELKFGRVGKDFYEIKTEDRSVINALPAYRTSILPGHYPASDLSFSQETGDIALDITEWTDRNNPRVLFTIPLKAD